MEKQINSAVNKIIKELKIDRRLSEAILYAVNSGGKRVRPKIACFVYEAKTGNVSGDILRMASAIEIIHTASLIHDDLPGIDNDDFRRNNPTLHNKYDEATAILAGDLLFTKGLEILSENERLKKVAADALESLINGEFLDVEYEKRDIEFHQWMNMVKGKTGALIKLSFETGAILADYTASETEKLGKAGEMIGIAFQMTDDLLDVVGDEKEVGKKLKKDSAEGKCTALNFFTIEKLKIQTEDYFKNAISIIEDMNYDFNGLIKFLNALKERTK